MVLVQAFLFIFALSHFYKLFTKRSFDSLQLLNEFSWSDLMFAYFIVTRMYCYKPHCSTTKINVQYATDRRHCSLGY